MQLTAREYWLDSLEIDNGANVQVKDAKGEVTFHVKGKVTINDKSTVGSENNKINIISYSNSDDSFVLEGESHLYGNLSVNEDAVFRS